MATSQDGLTDVTVKDVDRNIIKSAEYKYDVYSAEYKYDVYNQRLAKMVDADGSAVKITQRYVYGANQNIALAFDGNGTLTHRYLYGDGIDQIEADQRVATGDYALGVDSP